MCQHVHVSVAIIWLVWSEKYDLMTKHNEIGILVASIKVAQVFCLAASILFDFKFIAWDVWLNSQAWLHNLTTQLINQSFFEREWKRSTIKSPSSIKETSFGWSLSKKEREKCSCDKGSQTPGRILIQKQKTKWRLGTSPVESLKDKAREGREKPWYRYPNAL